MMQEIPGSNPQTHTAGEHRTTSERIPEQISGISEHIADMYNQFRESGYYSSIQDSKHQLREYIKDNPLQSVLYSAGAGLLLGLLFHRKR
ncbi:hypothetical protein B9H02_02010 [Prosthecochloris sp. HL-130-GSB]|nr:hypothetical protein B9H02_02010 [Prosthecochloris sp. HL-130-GSB]MBO8091946.1 hypothetical protein [Prosthecochloris sp.]